MKKLLRRIVSVWLILALLPIPVTLLADDNFGHNQSNLSDAITFDGSIIEITFPIQITFGAGETMNLARATNDTLWLFDSAGNILRGENNNVDVFTVADDGITTILSTSNGATEILLITVDPATPANNDEAQIAFRLDPSGAGAVRTFGRVDVALLDITDGAETAAWGADVWDSDGAGTMIEGINLIGRTGQDEMIVNNASVDFDVTFNWNTGVSMFWQGSDGFVGVNTITPVHLLHLDGGNIAFGDTTTGDVDVFLYIGTNGNVTAEFLKWDDGDSEFQMSDGLQITNAGTGTYGLEVFTNSGRRMLGIFSASGSNPRLEMENASGVIEVVFNTDGVSYVNTGNNVGFGTITPQAVHEINTGATDGAWAVYNDNEITHATFAAIDSSAITVSYSGDTPQLNFYGSDGDGPMTISTTTANRLTLSGFSQLNFGGSVGIEGLNGLVVNDSNGPFIVNETSSLTNPTLVPDRTDDNSGLGGDGSDAVALITGGVAGLTVDASQNVGIGATPAPFHDVSIYQSVATLTLTDTDKNIITSSAAQAIDTSAVFLSVEGNFGRVSVVSDSGETAYFGIINGGADADTAVVQGDAGLAFRFGNNSIIVAVDGTVSVSGKLITDSNGADTAVIQTIGNTGGSIDIFLSSATPEGAITGNLGDLTIVDTGTGDIFAKVSGSGNTGWLSLTGGGKNYASIFADDNSTATEIALVNSWQKFTQFSDNHPDNISTSDQSNSRITVGAAGDYLVLMIGNGAPAGTANTFEFNTFMLSTTATTITAATVADPVKISASGHGFSNGNKVAIKAAGGMVEINDRIFTVAGVSGADFNLQDDTPTNIDGTGFTTYTSGGTVQLAVEGHVHGDRKFANADRGGFHGGVIETLILNDEIEVYVKNVTDATNFTIEGLSLTITKEN